MPHQKKFYLKDIQDKIDNPYVTYSSNFLDQKEQALLEPILRKSKRDYFFDGGYDDSQRKILVLPSIFDNLEDFQVPIVSIVFQKPCELQHRNVLGTVLSLGLNRDVIGDIAIFDDIVQIVVKESLAEYISFNLTNINHYPIKAEILPYSEIIPYSTPYDLETVTTSSNRLDAVVAAIFRTSRKKAVRFIKEGLVMFNHLPIKKYTDSVKEGDTLSFKGKGKVEVTGFGTNTRKKKLRIYFKRFK